MSARTTIVATIRALSLLAALSASPGAVTAEACRPVRAINAESVLYFDRQQFDLLPRLEAVLARELKVADPPSAFDLKAIAGASIKLPRAVVLRPQPIEVEAFWPESFDLRFEKGNPREAIVERQGHRYLIAINEGRAFDADRGRVKAVPLSAGDHAVSLPQGSLLSVGADGAVRVAAGSRVIWERGNDDRFGLKLLQSARFEETSSDAVPVDVTVVKPVRLLPGGLMKIQVTANNFDLRNKRVVFCFAADAPDGGTPFAYTASARLATESAEGAVFETHVPSKMVRAIKRDVSWLDGLRDEGIPDVFGRPASVRVMGLDGERVVFQSIRPFVVTNFWLAFAAGFVLLLALSLSGLAFSRSLNIFALLGRMVRHPSQRMSLSNVQIMLWTLLVLYAFCFVWVANGMLLDISSGVLVLLGISGGTSVLSRTADKYDPHATTRPLAPKPEWSDLVTNRTGQFDLLRFQMLGFTLFTLAYAFVSVIRSEGLPEIPENLYLLMGISSTAYLGGKVADNMNQSDSAPGSLSLASSAAVTDYERALPGAGIQALQRAINVPATGVLDDATRQGIKAYKVAEGITPADGSFNALLAARLGVPAPTAGPRLDSEAAQFRVAANA